MNSLLISWIGIFPILLRQSTMMCQASEVLIKSGEPTFQIKGQEFQNIGELGREKQIYGM